MIRSAGVLLALTALVTFAWIEPGLPQAVPVPANPPVPVRPPAAGEAGQVDKTALAVQLAGLFVVATVLESALTTLFNWRLYREFFTDRAMKTIIMVAFGYIVVTAFDYDVFHSIVDAAGGSGPPSHGSRFLSALVLAGGSSTVYQLFKTLGLRPPAEPVAAAQPDESKAWVSLRVIRDKAIGEVKVHIERVANPTDEQKAAPPLAGVLAERRGVRQRIHAVFFADPMRLPNFGGRTVEAGPVYRISISGLRRAANPNDPPLPFADEPVHVGRFAGRAVIDLVRAV